MTFLSGETVEGWIVIHDPTSSFVDFFETEAEALLRVSELGGDYAAGFGQKELHSNNYHMVQNHA